VGGAALGGAAALPLLSRVPRFAGLLNPESGTSFFRTKLWLSAWRMFLDHPLLGVGPDNFLYQYRSFYILPEAWQDPNLSHPHNLALDHLSRLGLLGFVCGVWLHVGFWRVAVDAYRRLRQMDRELSALCVGLMASMADMLAHGLVDHAFFLIDLALVFGLTLGLAHRLQRFAREDL
jgi:O-antigen ligase